jgi:hypothetical protein
MKGCVITALVLFPVAMAYASEAGPAGRPDSADPLVRGWLDPPTDARMRAYWWWLNGNVTQEAITRDLEEMKAKGLGGALICDADGASQDGNDKVPHGPTFFSPPWRELYKHALREADRLGLQMSLNIQSGWNLGGPMVTAGDAPKKLIWSQQRVKGPVDFKARLERPKGRNGYYRDLFVLGYRMKSDAVKGRKPIRNQEQKALLKTLVPFSAPNSAPLFQTFPSAAGEEDARVADVLDLTAKLGEDGTLTWQVPEGEWEVLRFGCTLNNHCRVSTCSEGWNGYAIDPFDAGAFRRYWDAVVEPLIADAGPLAGRTLKFLHTDSWEVEVANWTPTLREEFKKRRGYDLVPWLPVIAGRIVNSRDESNRFLNDFRRTIGDLAIDNHYRLFRDRAHRHGLLIHPESGGPHAVPIDAQQCLGFDDAPMSEFWARSWRHRVGDDNRFFVKQPASAAHVYGHKLVLAEGFTTIGPPWQETLWDNLKPSFDKALCEGLNLLVWHAFVCSPRSEGMPGQQYFAGTHLNPNVTWWSRSGPFFDYINRCQWLLQQGRFVADVAYYYGDHVPNFTQHKHTDPARVLPGYDYDVITAEAILTRARVGDGRIVLLTGDGEEAKSDRCGMSYRVLVLPNRTVISLPVLRKLKDLVVAGATVVGPKPVRSESLTDFPQCDAEVAALAAELWGNANGTAMAEHNLGRGRVVCGRTAREVLLGDGIKPDCELTSSQPESSLDYIHRREGSTEIYFVANRLPRPESVRCTFRVTGDAPELWDPVSGQRRFAPAYAEADGRTTLPFDLPPCGSMFVVFRERASLHPATAKANEPKVMPLGELTGTWTVRFDPIWGAPRSARFDKLVSWTTRDEPGIRFYSGTATYSKSFDLPARARSGQDAGRLWLDLGGVRELAEVRVNGQPCGIVWAPPFRVDVMDAVKTGANHVEIDVVNFWPNRIIGDASLPREKRLTRTNVRKLTKDTKLMGSGLFGPVRLLLIGAEE